MERCETEIQLRMKLGIMIAELLPKVGGRGNFRIGVFSPDGVLVYLIEGRQPPFHR